MTTITAHFFDIKARLVEQLRTASESIQIAMAWFTDEELMSELMDIKYRHRQLSIMVVISNSEGNFRNSHNLKKLQESGIQLQVMREGLPFLHHKFCLIDDHIIINGSYNWTYYAAHKNEENITIIKVDAGDLILTQFRTKFKNYIRTDRSMAYHSDLMLPIASLALMSYDAEEIDLRKRFQERVLQSLREIESINPTRPRRERIRVELIHDMIDRYGDGVTMVKKLLNDEKVRDESGQLQPKSGFIKLVEWGRQNDLSFESMALNPEFEMLFTDDEKRICRQLLNQG